MNNLSFWKGRSPRRQPMSGGSAGQILAWLALAVSLATLAGGARAQAAAREPIPTFGDSPCVERPAAPASAPGGSGGAQGGLPGVLGLPGGLPGGSPGGSSGSKPPPPPAPTRIPGLRYECHVVMGGQPLFVGRAGPAQAPVLLLIHGLGQNAHTDWTEPVQALARDYQLVVVDLPGFGASPSPAGAYSFTTLGQQLAQLVTRLAPGQRVQVVGHSLGGAVALHFAHRHAALVDRLVLVDAAGILLKPVFMRHMMAQAVPQTGVTPIDQIFGRIGGRLRDLGSLLFLGRDDRYDITPWLMQNAEVRKALFGGVVQADAALTLVEQDFTAALREVMAPTTLIWGEADRIAPLRTGRVLAAHLPQARLRVIAGAGHTPMAEAPAEFNRLLREALAGPPPARTVFEPGAAAATAGSQGDLVCRQQDGLRYSGRIESLTLQGCRQVRIEGARIGRLVLSDALATLEDSSVGGAAALAIDARNSELIVTNALIRGRTALRAENSWFDLAGVSLRASERGIELRDGLSRAFFSLSEWQAPEYRGDAHFIWPRTPAGAPAGQGPARGPAPVETRPVPAPTPSPLPSPAPAPSPAPTQPRPTPGVMSTLAPQ
jgi:pimeloyl-ACP methyl ester carboxylesterase